MFFEGPKKNYLETTLNKMDKCYENKKKKIK